MDCETLHESKCSVIAEILDAGTQQLSFNPSSVISRCSWASSFICCAQMFSFINRDDSTYFTGLICKIS